MTQIPASESGGPSRLLDVLFGVILAGLLAGALASGFRPGPVTVGLSSVLTGLYIQAWGLLFVAAYFFPDGSYLLRALMWCCENVGFPRGEWTALLWGAFALSVGTGGLLGGLGWVEW